MSYSQLISHIADCIVNIISTILIFLDVVPRAFSKLTSVESKSCAMNDDPRKVIFMKNTFDLITIISMPRTIIITIM